MERLTAACESLWLVPTRPRRLALDEAVSEVRLESHGLLKDGFGSKVTVGN